MAESELKIDDDCCKAIGNYLKNEGKIIENKINKYIFILENIKNEAIMEGDAHNALDGYIEYAKKIKGEIGKILEGTKNDIEKFLKDIDKADEYLF